MARPARVSPEQILDAAAREFAERGYAGARVDRIARRAAVNKAMLYYHFASKRQLYRTLLRRMFARAADRFIEDLPDGYDTPVGERGQTGHQAGGIGAGREPRGVGQNERARRAPPK